MWKWTLDTAPPRRWRARNPDAPPRRSRPQQPGSVTRATPENTGRCGDPAPSPPPRSRSGDFGLRGLKSASQFASPSDAELGEHVAQVPLDGASTQEQAGSDVRVGEPVAGELGDLTLVRGEIVAGLGDPPTCLLTRCEELATGAFGERPHPHRREQLMRKVELGARVEPAALAPQSFAIQKMR